MDAMYAYLNLANNTTQDFHIKLSEIIENNVHAVYVNGFSNGPLNSEFGAAIEFAIDGVKSWMADYRYSEYWCRPAFGSNFSDIPTDTQGFVY